MITIIIFMIWHDSKCKKSNFLPCQIITIEQPTGYIATVQLQHISNGSIKRYRNTVLLQYLFQSIGAQFTFSEHLFARQTGISVLSTNSLQNQRFRDISPQINSKITSIPTSSKPNKIKHFTTFHTIKNHHYPASKYHQTLINQYFNRTPPKIPYLTKK